jgi:hypothetical protein
MIGLVVALGMAGNVVQFVDFGMKSCYRIKEYSTTAGASKKLVAQADCLSDLLKCPIKAEQDAPGRDLISCSAEATK